MIMIVVFGQSSDDLASPVSRDAFGQRRVFGTPKVMDVFNHIKGYDMGYGICLPLFTSKPPLG